MVLSAEKKTVPVKAMLDTGNRGLNYVSYELVIILKMQKSIKYHDPKHCPVLKDASGNEVRSLGTIQLDFHFLDQKKRHRYEKWHNNEEFNILPSEHIQVNFGAAYIERMELLKLGDGALTPLTADRKLNSCMLFIFSSRGCGTV
jgi:hypothetical protein